MSDVPFPGLPAALPARRRSRALGAGTAHRLVQTEVPAATGPTKAAPARSREAAIPVALPLREMAGGIAHDFRNLLAVIASALDLAQRHRGDRERTDLYLAGARGAVDRAAALATRLLALARPAPPAVRADNLSRLVREWMPFLTYAAGPRIGLRLDLCDEEARCAVDPARFGAALLNLVANARDAMPEGGEIVISTATGNGDPTDSGFVRVRVSDSGEGMPAEVEARMFEPWFTTKAATGTGLGLPQVQRLMRLVDGRVSVATGPDGTVIDLHFPVDVEGAATADVPGFDRSAEIPPPHGTRAEAAL